MTPKPGLPSLFTNDQHHPGVPSEGLILSLKIYLLGGLVLTYQPYTIHIGYSTLITLKSQPIRLRDVVELGPIFGHYEGQLSLISDFVPFSITKRLLFWG